MGGMVDGVKRERLHKGRCLRAMGGGGGELRIRTRRAGADILWLAAAPLFGLLL
jgi:hypothetical protein